MAWRSNVIAHWASKVLVGRKVLYLFRKMCSLYLSIMDRMGIKADKFGSAPSLKATGALRFDRKVVLKRRQQK